jgi:GNAT superfamily N-acetyltransferase
VNGASSTLLDTGVAVADHSPSEAELVCLRDGLLVTIRPVCEDDETPLWTYLSNLGAEARRMRFFSGAADVVEAAHWAADLAPDRYGLVVQDEAGTIVGHAVYIQLKDPRRAEVAVEIADRLRGRGLGTILIERLAAIAERRGITYFEAEVLCENHAMLDIFREGFDARVIRHAGPEESVEFLTAGWRLARERFGSSEPR